MRIARAVFVIYLGVVAVLYSLQTRVIFPGAERQGHASSDVRPRPDTELVNLATASGVRVTALFGPALTRDGKPDDQAGKRPTMIFFYGNGNCLSDVVSLFDRFRRMGLNVLIPDYVGYGMSGGSPSERGCQATADAAYDYLVSKRGIDPGRLIAGGWSLGGGVAIDLASRKQVGGLIAFSTFTSMVDMARRLLPFVPVSLLLRHRFDSVRKIATIQCPTLIGHGRRDEVVPFRMGEKLAASAAGPITTLWIDEADHNGFFEIGGNRIEHAIKAFLNELK